MEKGATGTDPATDSSDGVEEAEESGWTDYLEDFSSKVERQSSFCSSVGSCSSVSDSDANVFDRFSSVGDAPNTLSFKKTRTQKIFEDDSLEDTATSPVHSPKVADLRVRTSHVNPRFDDHMTISSSTGSGRPSENYYTDTGKAVYPADIKKRGLCLFPLSMLLHYRR